MRYFFGIIGLALIAGCGSKSNPAAPAQSQLKPGWTPTLLTNTTNACMGTIPGSLNNPSNATAICQCWTNSLSTQFTPDQLDSGDPTVETQVNSLLQQCSSPLGENPKMLVRAMLDAFARAPQSEPTPAPAPHDPSVHIPRLVQKALDRLRAKQKPPATDHGPATVPPPSSRPVAPAPAPKPVAPAAIDGNATLHLTHYIKIDPLDEEHEGPGTLLKPYLRKTGQEETVRFEGVHCGLVHSYDGTDGLIIEIRSADDSKKSKFTIDLRNYRDNQHHYSLTGEDSLLSPIDGDPMTVLFVRNPGAAHEMSFGTTGSSSDDIRSYSQVTNLQIKDGVLTGSLSFLRLAGYDKATRSKAHLTAADFPYADAEGTFRCSVTDTRHN